MATDEAAKKLQALTIINEALQSENEELRRELEDGGGGTHASAADLEDEIAELKEEFESRLATTEKTIILLKSERENLLKRLDAAHADVDAHAASVQDKDAALLALRAEGDALSRKQGEVEAAARKLRAALKDTEVQRDELRQKLEALEQEAHKSKLSVQASSDEVQSEAARAEKEASEREAALQASVAAHATRMASLQATLAAAEARSATREDALRAQLARLERRCQELEAARDELVANDTEATVPLLRELEAVTAAAARAADAAADTEARLLSRLQSTESALLAAQTAERSAKARAQAAEQSSKEALSRASALTEQLAAANAALEEARARNDSLSHRLQEDGSTRQAAAAAFSAAEAQVRTLQGERDRVAKALADAQKTWQLREAELLSRVLELQDALAKSTESGAALETALRAHQSMSESAPLAPSAAAEQVHHAELPARRGEVAELRRQLSLLEDARRHDQRMLLVAEERAQAVVSTAADHGRLLQELKALQAQHATALELLGERNERVDELTQDLVEAKTIYRSQILMLCPRLA